MRHVGRPRSTRCVGRHRIAEGPRPRRARTLPSKHLRARNGRMRNTPLSILITVAGVLPAIAPAQDDAVPAFKQLDSIEARVQGCVTCHGQSGQGTENGYFPRIAGKPAGYLYNQLVAFRDGTRRYPPMNYLVAYLPDPYLREIAEHFAQLRPPFVAREQPTVDPGVLARGEALVAQGDALRGIPACV